MPPPASPPSPHLRPLRQGEPRDPTRQPPPKKKKQLTPEERVVQSAKRKGQRHAADARDEAVAVAALTVAAQQEETNAQVICLILEEEGDIDKFKGYKPSAADVSKAKREPPKPNNEVQLSSVKGTGPDGGILKADIEDYLAKGGKSESFAASGLACTDIPNAQIRKVTADRLLASKQTIPHYYLTVDTPVNKLIKLRGELNPLQEASGGKKISKDLVRKDADKTGLATIGEEVKRLAQRARDNSLKPQDYEAFSDFPDFVCSDRGGYPGSNNGKCNYISKMNYYLRAGE
nr:dihydrolipoyllysine-residue acetyltransferase component 3 of pyruvate dehydrogenase complex, mitochondrial-like [Aegilops tauschii subsp. strangulata]